MKFKYSFIFFIVVTLMIISIVSIPSMNTTLQNNKSQNIKLYYMDNNELNTLPPVASSSQTYTFGPSLMALSKSVGRWSPQPLTKPITITGSIVSTMWASGSGTIYFENRIYVNNEYTGIIFSSGTLRLSQTPQEYTSTETGVELELVEGDIFEVDIAIYTFGRGGTVYWGSEEHPSNIILNCDSVLINAPSYDIDASSQKVNINSTIVPAFGIDDIANYSLQISGPSNVEHITEQEPEIINGQLQVTWLWSYSKDNTKFGKEYTITINVEDNSGNKWTLQSKDAIILEQPKEEGFAIQSDFMQVLIIITVAGIIIFLLVYWLFLKKKAEEMVEILKNSTNYFSDYKLLVGSEVLHWLSWYLLLVISLFIFRAAWPGWGDLLVGLNYASYQTISTILFLSLAKNSDVKGKRKNLLLTLIVVGTALLFIMAWLSLVPTPAVIIIIIILFTFFVLCFYGLDSLKVVLITEYFPEKIRGSAFGLMRAVGNIGGLIGGVLSGFLFEVIGFWFCFLLGAFVLISSFFIMFKIRDVDVIEVKITINDWFKIFIFNAKQTGVKFNTWLKNVFKKINMVTINNYLFEFQNKRQMTFLFYTTLFTLIAYGMIVPYIMVFLSESRGESATVLSIVYTVFGIAIFLPINQLLAGWLCDKYGARKVYSGAIFAYIALWGIFNLTIPMTSSNVIIMAVFIFPVWPFLWIGFKLFVTDITPRTERARGITSIQLALGIGIVIGSIGGGLLLLLLSYETVFLLAMVFTFIAAGFAMMLLRITGNVETVETEVEALPIDG